MKPSIFLITGMMASGKSTVAELLASKLQKGVHVRGDVFRRMIVSGREEMSPHPSAEAMRQFRLRCLLAAETTKKYYDNGFSVVLQDNYYGAQLPYILELLSGYPVQTTVLCPRPDVIKAREQARGKTGYAAFTVDSLFHSFLEETPRTGFWLDTSAQTPEETVNEILVHFNAG